MKVDGMEPQTPPRVLLARDLAAARTLIYPTRSPGHLARIHERRARHLRIRGAGPEQSVRSEARPQSAGNKRQDPTELPPRCCPNVHCSSLSLSNAEHTPRPFLRFLFRALLMRFNRRTHQIGRYREARDTYLEAIRRKPDFVIAIIHLGNLYFQLGRYRGALEQYREYVRLAPSNKEEIRGHDSSSWVYRKKGDFANAEREAAEADRLYQHTTKATLLLQADRGRPGLTDDLRRQIHGTPENPRIWYFVLGYVALRDHKTEEALQYLRTRGRRSSDLLVHRSARDVFS